MATATKEKLSGSTDGKQIKVAATATAGTLIHTATSSTTTVWDEIWLWANNTQSAAVVLTIEWGGTTSPDNLIELTIPGETGAMLVIPGWILQNSLVVRAFAGTGNVVMISGYVNRITN